MILQNEVDISKFLIHTDSYYLSMKDLIIRYCPYCGEFLSYLCED